ncbi:MAG: ParB/RepB/Spo0J family partition protein [Arcobacteraceae bacterium]|jgi:ParB/RepB/Spo0J family partition protein
MAKKKFEDFEEVLDASEFVTNLLTQGTAEIDINLINPNPYQPRFDEEKPELTASIKAAYESILSSNDNDDSLVKPEDGLLQPITITLDPNNEGEYIITDGHCRLNSCKNLDHKTIKYNLVKTTLKELKLFALVGNLQRTDLLPLETALSIDSLLKDGAFESAEEVAAALGKTSSWVSKCRSILKLSDVIIENLQKDKSKIGLEILVDLQRIQCVATQEQLYFKYLMKDINGSDIRAAIKEEKRVKVPGTATSKSLNQKGTFEANVWFLSGLKILDKDEIVSKLEQNYKYKYSIKETKAFVRSIIEDEDGITFDFIATKENIKELKGKGLFDELSKKMLPNNIYTMIIDLSSKKGLFDKPTEEKEISQHIPKDTFNEKSTEYVKIKDISDITETLRNAVQSGYRIIKNKLKYGIDKDEILTLDNCYEKEIYNLLVEIEENKRKDIYIISYHQKKGSAGGGGYRVRAVNQDIALEEGKKHYTEEANDKNTIMWAEPLNRRNNAHISHGFGTQNDKGTYVTLVDGDFKGTVTIEECGEFVKTTNNKEYKVIIEEV